MALQISCQFSNRRQFSEDGSEHLVIFHQLVCYYTSNDPAGFISHTIGDARVWSVSVTQDCAEA